MAITGVGTTFGKESPGSSGTYTNVAEIKNIEGPSSTRETVDTTSLDTVGGYRTFITGFRDGGTVTLSMNFTSAGYALLLADFESNTMNKYKITLMDNSTIEFSGMITDMPLTIPEDVVLVNVTIKVSGRPTFTAGA